jgi:hypothetical protein
MTEDKTTLNRAQPGPIPIAEASTVLQFGATVLSEVSDPVSANPFMGGIICLRKRTLWPHRLSFAELRFHGLGCGKFAISVGLGAQGTRMQFASFLGRCTTSRTRHG